MFTFSPGLVLSESDASKTAPVPQVQKNEVEPSRRRDKPRVSCLLCRQKKLKCDRLKPCHNCVKRGHPQSCDYVKNETRGRPSANVQDRVKHLEQVVRSLLERQGGSDQFEASASSSLISAARSRSTANDEAGLTPTSTISPRSEEYSHPAEPSVGKFTKAREQENYVGSDNWEAILEDITALKIDLETPDVPLTADFKPQILFGNNQASRPEIMSSIPPRPLCDFLIKRWFAVNDMAPMMIHAPTFMKEYNRMFENPDSTPLMWIGLLFSFLGLAVYFCASSGEELNDMPPQYSSLWDMSDHFRDRTAQCLVEVNYLRPGRYTVETLCIYYGLETVRGGNSEFGSYVLLATIVRVAMRLGYHRDASHYPNISALDGEMRRRVWSLVFQLDILTATQVGLPRMIREGEIDTAEPSNLLDSDFDENTLQLPQPRPSSHPTPVAHIKYKIRVLRHLGLIVDQLNLIVPPSYDEVMALDFKLTDMRRSLPEYMTVKPLSLCVSEDANSILRRYIFEVSYQKSRCILHRKYLIRGKSHSQFRYSRNASIDAAMRLLDVQLNFNQASQPGGQLAADRWRTAALLNQDYVLAATIICLDCTWDRKLQGVVPSLAGDDDLEALWPRSVRLQYLRSSCNIWSESSTVSALAAKASEALKFMLKNLKTTGSSAQHHAHQLIISDMPVYPEPYNGQVLSDPLEGFDFDAFLPTTDFSTGPMDIDMNFDWALWDSQFQPALMAPEDFNSMTFQ